MKRLTLGSLFDGIGGFTLAAQRCGIKTLWASEIEPNCVEITRRHFPGVKHLGDIREIDGGKVPPVDIISFGSPCQDLSTAGHRRGLIGEKSSLFLEAVRIITEMRYATRGKSPTFIIWENVPGAFNSNERADFRAVIEILTKTRVPMPRSGRWASAGMAGSRAGGANIAWRVFDSQFWGVPQRRDRIFLVGDFRGKRGPEILFKCDSVYGYVGTGAEKGKDASAPAGNRSKTQGREPLTETVIDFGRAGDRVRINAQKSATIIATDCGGGAATGLYLLQDGQPLTHAINLQLATRHKQLGERTGLGVSEAGEPAYTLQAAHSHAIFAVYPINDGVIHGNANGLGIGKNGEPAPTLTANDKHSIAVCFAPSGHGGYKEGVGPLRARMGKSGRSSSNLLVILEGPDGEEMVVRYTLRKLTPLECERLQGFPDYWTKYNATGAIIADTPRYTAIGNSLTVPCAERIFRGIVAVMTGGG